MTISTAVRQTLFQSSIDREVVRLPPRGITARNAWTLEEHERFLQGLTMFPKGPWKLIADCVGTRSARQTMTHAQKYRQKIDRRQRAYQQKAAWRSSVLTGGPEGKHQQAREREQTFPSDKHDARPCANYSTGFSASPSECGVTVGAWLELVPFPIDVDANNPQANLIDVPIDSEFLSIFNQSSFHM